MQRSIDEAYRALACAIVERAVDDYRSALKALSRNPDSRAVDETAGACEKFFRSEWYGILTDIDGELIIDTINREVSGR